MKLTLLNFTIILLISSGCSTIDETSKHPMETGIYNVKNRNNKRFYVVVEEDSISLHPVKKTKAGWLADTSRGSTIYINTTNPMTREPIKFLRPSFDLDVMTILFKYRPYTAGFPNQLNTNFSAAEFIGYRTDLYILSYAKNPLNSYHHSLNHFAYSYGGFVGLGATQMNPFVTNNNLQSEYDGVVLIKGIAGLIGIGDLTFGAAIGLDHLMDKNHKVWIYQGKPWVGFSVGLNLN